MTIVLWVAIGLLTVAAMLGLFRVITAPDDASRAVVGDLSYFSAVGIFVLVAMLTESAVLFDVASVAGLVGILATIALSRILTRGRR